MSDFFSLCRNVKIISGKNKNQYKIIFKDENKYLINSILSHKLEGMTTNPTFTNISFYADTLLSFPNFLNNVSPTDLYSVVINFLYSINNQLINLIKNNYCFTCLLLQDIIVIDNHTFIYINPKYLSKINCDNMIKLNYPFPKQAFLSPEVSSLTYIPFFTSYKSIYYSLGSMLIHILFQSQDNINDINPTYNMKSENDIINILYPIRFTKLYWCIIRLMKNCYHKRLLLFL